MSTEPTWLSQEASRRAIEALTDTFIVFEDHTEPYLKSLTAEQLHALRPTARADAERWRNARNTICRRAAILMARAELIGHTPSEAQEEAWSKFVSAQDPGDGMWMYFDHLTDTDGRMVTAGILSQEVVNQVASTIHSRVA
ncbi:hypothetical protein [Mycobacterium aquaticum]|uniref:Uncharacterized protein n=1 Tax=Mycobacterium aquaticum TaxID=1927124 RepID=A0A1X0ABD7_9MYCO|nr:hypothetical protein [Mycobacterium aquaticum]ORA27380.1 hypothetical protein BST13_30450 [Mycobacterium aquaticum]